mmetsp:Transcript_34746/g.92650  ORF Transcript_34746/g.92650 Transcript_34746/m.92650 type:complete len:128 (-) Transcript_34746:75-458(-)
MPLLTSPIGPPTLACHPLRNVPAIFRRESGMEEGAENDGAHKPPLVADAAGSGGGGAIDSDNGGALTGLAAVQGVFHFLLAPAEVLGATATTTATAPNTHLGPLDSNHSHALHPSHMTHRLSTLVAC